MAVHPGLLKIWPRPQRQRTGAHPEPLRGRNPFAPLQASWRCLLADGLRPYSTAGLLAFASERRMDLIVRLAFSDGFTPCWNSDKAPSRSFLKNPRAKLPRMVPPGSSASFRAHDGEKATSAAPSLTLRAWKSYPKETPSPAPLTVREAPGNPPGKALRCTGTPPPPPGPSPGPPSGKAYR